MIFKTKRKQPLIQWFVMIFRAAKSENGKAASAPGCDDRHLIVCKIGSTMILAYAQSGWAIFCKMTFIWLLLLKKSCQINTWNRAANEQYQKNDEHFSIVRCVSATYLSSLSRPFLLFHDLAAINLFQSLIGRFTDRAIKTKPPSRNPMIRRILLPIGQNVNWLRWWSLDLDWSVLSHSWLSVVNGSNEATGSSAKIIFGSCVNARNPLLLTARQSARV